MSEKNKETDLIIGRNAVKEALRSGRAADHLLVAKGTGGGSLTPILALCREKKIPVKEADAKKLDFLCGGGAHQGVILFAAARAYASLEDCFALAAARGEPPFLILCDGLEDPHNLGAIIRSAEAAGAHGVIIPERRSVSLSSYAGKAAAGALEYVPVVRVGNLHQTATLLKERGVWLYCADMDGEEMYSLDLTGLLSLNYLFKNGDKIGFTTLYAKNATEDYKLRDGYDAEDNQLLGSNSIAHSYSLWNNQLGGSNTLAKNWLLDWKVSYSMTDSNEPDRRQVMYRKGEDGSLSLFKLNRQETMRYYGELSEQEVVAEIKPTFSFGEKSRLIFGAAYKDKTRDYNSLRFYYNLSNINPVISDIYTPSTFLNAQSIADGLISIERDAQPKNNYYAGHRIIAGFAEVEYYPIENLLIGLGIRYEYSQQWVRYWNDASRESVSRLNKGDFFPALNLKYTLNKKHSFRFASSTTVTRPSFIEMAPFLYKESYGSAELRGNDQLTNGYNYNFDLKYEFFSTDNRHMFSIGAYYKILKDPIERVQETSGGAIVHTFRNAQQGMAAGLEAEFRTQPFKYFTIGGNVSLMYTDVTLLDGGIYTDSRRALQGASPYIGNAFITYAPEFGEESSLAVSVLYNVQGPRIQAVGIYGLGNIMQAPIHDLDANITYQINRLWSVQLSLTNLLDSEYRFTQNVPDLGEEMLTESYRLGRGIGVGVKLDF